MCVVRKENVGEGWTAAFKAEQVRVEVEVEIELSFLGVKLGLATT